MKIKYYFTLQEALQHLFSTDIEAYNNTATFYATCNALNVHNLPFTTNDPHIARLWVELYALNYDECIYTNCDGEFKQEEFKKWFFKVCAIISRTFDYYDTLLNGYDDLKDKLLDDIKTTNKTTIKYNDTPQSDGTYFDDEHTTNITDTLNEATTPYGTPLEKLKSLQDNYTMLYNKWCKEFNKIFIEMQ